MLSPIYNLSTWQSYVRKSEVQVHTWLHIKLDAIMRYMRHCLIKKLKSQAGEIVQLLTATLKIKHQKN